MATGAMFWGGAAYNNGILPFKNYMFGEAYTGWASRRRSSRQGVARTAPSPRLRRHAAPLPQLYPLPTWHVVPPADVFRVFERGGRTIGTQFRR